MNFDPITEAIKRIKARMKTIQLRDGACKKRLCVKEKCGGCIEMECLFGVVKDIMSEYYGCRIDIVKAKEVAK